MRMEASSEPTMRRLRPSASGGRERERADRVARHRPEHLLALGVEPLDGAVTADDGRGSV